MHVPRSDASVVINTMRDPLKHDEAFLFSAFWDDFFFFHLLHLCCVVLDLKKAIIVAAVCLYMETTKKIRCICELPVT